jgi:(E)-4-hydroxy-3-methylbut-2-enyl-diphosphate synthase
MIKSSVGIGALLAEGIGDTLRVSLTGSPEDEVKVGWEILKSLNLRQRGPEFISCPTCGRTEINLADLATKVEKAFEKLEEPLNIAVMGCPVNGPGEAKHCDYGIAGGKGQGIIFRKGVVVEKVPEKDLLERFVNLLQKDGYKVL